MIGKCSCCKKIKWIFKNKKDTLYNQKACWKCYCNSVEVARESNRRIKENSNLTCCNCGFTNKTRTSEKFKVFNCKVRRYCKEEDIYLIVCPKCKNVMMEEQKY